MALAERAEGLSPEQRASIFHFTVFGTTGVASAYLSIWLSGKGLSSEQIGIVNALPVLLILMVNVLIGRLADKASDWRAAIVILSLIAGIVPIAFFFVNEFWGLLLVYALVTLPSGALVPVIDAATLRLTQRRGTQFGSVRAWGTVGYMVTAAGTGLLIGWLGPAAFVPLYVALALLRSGLAFQLPRFRAPAHIDEKSRRASGVTLLSLMRPWFLLPCIAFALLQSTHLFLGSMGSLVWKLDGIPEGWIGPLIAVSAAAEAAMMFSWRRIGAGFPARTLIIIAGLVATARWIAMAMNPALPLLVGLQLLHAITYPFSYFGVMHFVANWAPEDIAAEAQSFAFALTQGFAVVTLVVFGWLIGLLGGGTYYVAAAMALAAAAAAYLSLLLRPAHKRSENPVHG